MTILTSYLPTIFSSLFRVAIYIFLRVIPSTLGKPILPTLYFAYLLSCILFPRRPGPIKSEKVQHAQSARRHDVLSTLILSLPTTSRSLRISNALLNTLLLIAAADFVTTPYLDSAADAVFTRVGAVYPDSVKIVVRYPHNNTTGGTPLLLYRELADSNTTGWEDGPLLTLTPDQDWVDTVKVEGLWPNTSYECFDLLADYLYSQSQSTTSGLSKGVKEADFMLFLGDFIYADVPIYIGDDKEAYRRLYRRNYHSASFRKIYERLPNQATRLHLLTSAQFINNFGASGNDSTPPYLNASGAFRLYNSNANFDPMLPGEHYYEFRYGDAAFFVMDTRRYRTAVGTSNRTMLGETQLAFLYEWLSRVNGTSTFIFVVTSVPFTSLWGHDAQFDSWAGFPEEKQALLTAFHSIPNVILLSGDRHEFAAIEFTSPNPESYPVLEFSTSPLSMFYIPFVRTLRLQSDSFVLKNRTRTISTENGLEIVNFVEEVPLERVIKYIPTGNSKWSTLEIDSTNITSPKLKLETMIDGSMGFSYDLTGFPVKMQTSTAIGAFVVGGVKDIINKFGIKPSKWF
ncbi:hypothetical protein H0H87_001368 [Tephrocybe sp. NHM501043]|nr:hypothetical protein H0H87_001368 [Tephrocybe sp. NHM501043]